VLLAVAWIAAPFAADRALAQEAADPAATAAPAPEPDPIEPAAREAVKRMVETLTGAERLSYEYESSFDALQDDGELLEFGGRGKATVRRPDRLRGEIWGRDGRHVRWAWDGANVAVLDETNKVFATTPRTGDIDDLFDFLRDDVGMKLPTADLFSSDLRELLIESVVAARHVGKERIDDVGVDHVALRLRTGIDAQLWIEEGEHAFPRRLVLNFATADGRPGFRADFDEWDLDPSARDSSFVLKQPKDARRIPFKLESRQAMRATQQTEEEAR
jgi:hypothetical protein